jgi:hypothetical protein
MSTNPFQSPTPSPPGFGPDPGSYAAEKTNLPGLLIAITAGISILVRVVFLFLGLMGAGLAAAGGDDGGNAVVQMASGLVGQLIGIALNGVTLWGGLQMRNLQNYSLAMAAAVLATIPCCSPCVILGIPFGIWALIVLNDVQVKSAFRS